VDQFRKKPTTNKSIYFFTKQLSLILKDAISPLFKRKKKSISSIEEKIFKKEKNMKCHNTNETDSVSAMYSTSRTLTALSSI